MFGGTCTGSQPTVLFTISRWRLTYRQQLRNNFAEAQRLDDRRQEQTVAVDWRDDEEVDPREHLAINIRESHLDPMPVELLLIDVAASRAALAVDGHSLDCSVLLFFSQEFGVRRGMGQEEPRYHAECDRDGALDEEDERPAIVSRCLDLCQSGCEKPTKGA